MSSLYNFHISPLSDTWLANILSQSGCFFFCQPFPLLLDIFNFDVISLVYIVFFFALCFLLPNPRNHCQI